MNTKERLEALHKLQSEAAEKIEEADELLKRLGDIADEEPEDVLDMCGMGIPTYNDKVKVLRGFATINYKLECAEWVCSCLKNSVEFMAKSVELFPDEIK